MFLHLFTEFLHYFIEQGLFEFGERSIIQRVLQQGRNQKYFVLYFNIRPLWDRKLFLLQIIMLVILFMYVLLIS